MKVVDINVLIYATDTETKHHTAARGWLDSTMQSITTIGLPTAVTIGYMRITTNPRIMKNPLTIEQSQAVVTTWLGRSNVVVPQPTNRHYEIVADLVSSLGVGGNIISDAHLAALAIEHGAEIVSFDSDFARFPGLNWEQPIPASG